MFRPLELFIGLRYTRAKRRNHFISFISLVSMLGIAVGVTALIAVISVMNGFDKELRTRILGMVAHATVEGVGESIANWRDVVARAESNRRVLGAAPYIEREAMLQAERVAGALVRGIEPEQEAKVSEVGHKLIAGSMDGLRAGAFGIVLGKELAYRLGVEVGGSVVVYAPEFRATPVGAVPRLKRFHVVGIFEAGMEEYDAGLAVVHLEDAERLYQMDGPGGVRLKLDDMFAAFGVARELAADLGGGYRVRDWMAGHSNFFRAVAMEKRVMFIILTLIVAVAAFNLVSTLVMTVTDKRADIAILRTLGASPRSIMGIFFVQGAAAGLVGTTAGVLLGLGIALEIGRIVPAIEHLLGTTLLPASIYFINRMPSLPLASDIVPIALASLALAFVATLYPSWRASRVRPAMELRAE